MNTAVTVSFSVGPRVMLTTPTGRPYIVPWTAGRRIADAGGARIGVRRGEQAGAPHHRLAVDGDRRERGPDRAVELHPLAVPAGRDALLVGPDVLGQGVDLVGFRVLVTVAVTVYVGVRAAGRVVTATYWSM